MPAGSLKKKEWMKLMASYPDPKVVEAILGICRFGARIGSEYHRMCITVYPNLTSGLDHPATVTGDILKEVTKNRLECYQGYSTLPQ